MKATAQAPANIAFIKYWGKADENLRLPLNSSISMNLSGAYSETTVDFSPKYEADQVEFLEGSFSEKEKARIIKSLNLIRIWAGIKDFARIATRNSFPKGIGAAASASGFAALTVAASNAAGLKLSEKELTIIARRGSGSACRSIPDGFVIWEKGSTNEDSYAYSLYPHTWWNLRDILVVVDTQMKKVSTTEGQEGARTSPLLKDRLQKVPERIQLTLRALKEKNFTALGDIIEEDCLEMHRVIQTQTPPINYWTKETIMVMAQVRRWRQEGLAVYFTIDAGPNVHLICEGKDEEKVMKVLRSRIWLRQTIKEIIVNKPAKGTRIVRDHLF